MKLDSLDKNALHMALDKLITEYEKKEPERCEVAIEEVK